MLPLHFDEAGVGLFFEDFDLEVFALGGAGLVLVFDHFVVAQHFFEFFFAVLVDFLLGFAFGLFFFEEFALPVRSVFLGVVVFLSFSDFFFAFFF